MDRRRAAGETFNMRTVVAMMVPYITELAERHAAGESVFVHPSAIAYDPSGARLIEEQAAAIPAEPRDRACLAPEQRGQATASARSSVFGIGAVLYELVTGHVVGPGMSQPSDHAPGISHSFEVLLSRALISDPEGRPADLAALAHALHHCAPTASIPPPGTSAHDFEEEDDFDVDLSMSMLPPPPTGDVAAKLALQGAPGQAAPVVIAPPASLPQSMPGSTPGSAPGSAPQSSVTSTAMLADLKQRLESDPRPRYVVIKEGMDHGPFTAVELLQQIASSSFRSEHFLRDVLSKDERQIANWEEFAPFAEHTTMHRAATQEKQALEAKVAEESVQTQNKALIAGGVLLLGVAALGGWWYRASQSQNIRIGVSSDEAQSIDFEAGLKEGKQGAGPRKGGGRWPGSSGDSDSSGSAVRPVVSGGGSCESARAAYVEEYKMNNDTPPDLTAGSYGAVLNRGTYLNSCGVPPSMAVTICAAVQNGRAVGVTVRTRPVNGTVAGCVRGSIFGMSFPSHPRLDVSTTVFKSE